MAAAAQILSPPSLKRPLAWSAGLHAILIGWTILVLLYHPAGNAWSGAAGSATVIGVVSGLPGIPLPRPDMMTTSRTVDTTKGLYKSDPAVKPPPDDAATRLPEFEKNKPPRYISRPSKTLEDTTPPPTNAVPFGQGGAPAAPYTQFSMSNGTAGGIGMGGPGGDFGSRYPWYVDAVRRRISANWLQSSVDPAIRFAPRVVVQFQILRDGSAANIQITHSSGNSSVDTSAIRAVRDSSPLERLPTDYSGGFVAVEFWFEFRR
jgi:periplasmic protein TonB